MLIKNSKIEEILKRVLVKKVRITTANMIAFLLLGVSSFALENGDIIGEKYIYRDGRFYRVDTSIEVSVNFINDNIIEIEGIFYSPELYN